MAKAARACVATALAALAAAAFWRTLTEAVLFEGGLGRAERLALTASAFCLAAWIVSPRGLWDKVPTKAFLIFLGGLALGLRAAWIVSVPNKQVSDFALYHELAGALASGKGYAITGPVGVEDLAYAGAQPKSLPYRTAYRSPGAAFFGALIYRLCGVDALWIKIANALLGAGACLLLWRLLDRAGFPRQARGAALLWCVYPSAVFASGLFCSEILFVFSLLLLAVLLEGGSEDGGGAAARAGLGGAAAAWCCLVRPMTAPLLAAVMGCRLRRGGRGPGRRAALFLLAFGACLLPWAARNWRAFHRFIPICTLEGELLGRHTAGLVPEAARLSPEYRQRWARWRATEQEAELSARGYGMALYHFKLALLGGPGHLARRALSNLSAAFGSDLGMLGWSTLNHWGLAQGAGPREALSRPASQRLAAATQAFYLALAALGFLGALRADWPKLLGREPLGFLSLYFLIAFCLHAAIPGPDRYHFALMPFVAILASFAKASI